MMRIRIKICPSHKQAEHKEFINPFSEFVSCKELCECMYNVPILIRMGYPHRVAHIRNYGIVGTCLRQTATLECRNHFLGEPFFI